MKYLEGKEAVLKAWNDGEAVCVEFEELIHGKTETVDFYITEESGRTEADVIEFIENEDCKFFVD